MSGLRFTLDLYIPESSSGTVVAGIRIPTALANQIPSIRSGIQNLKSYARKINTSAGNEEMTIKAKYHVCHHEDGKACESEQEI